MAQLTQHQTKTHEARVRTPWWRRITAVFTLSSMVVLAGLFLAGLITLTLLMVLYLLEQAIA
ncbi:MAG: hypothetical protein OEW83_02860 [Acidimicrobiia bacterium]|nr:hypothetical protein [Acidimicrobiia bacterium]